MSDKGKGEALLQGTIPDGPEVKTVEGITFVNGVPQISDGMQWRIDRHEENLRSIGDVIGEAIARALDSGGDIRNALLAIDDPRIIVRNCEPKDSEPHVSDLSVN